jgi:pimeloyl-ACP methyl ester carboxylesterase
VPGRGEMFVREAESPRPAGSPVVLLLHGWTLSSDLNWFPSYDAVARYGRMVALDQRGHGRGLRSEHPFTLEAAADDAAALLGHLGVGPAVVVGYSMGGSVALLLWHRHPQLVAGLVLESTALQWRTSRWDRMLWSGMAVVEYAFRLGPPRGLTERYLRDAVDQSPALQRYTSWLKAEIRRGSPADLAAAGRALSAFDARPFASQVDVPTVVVVTRRDRLVRPSRQRELAEAIPGASVVEVETAHNGWLVRPRAFVAATEEALEVVLARLHRRAAGATEREKGEGDASVVPCPSSRGS